MQVLSELYFTLNSRFMKREISVNKILQVKISNYRSYSSSSSGKYAFLIYSLLPINQKKSIVSWLTRKVMSLYLTNVAVVFTLVRTESKISG